MKLFLRSTFSYHTEEGGESVAVILHGNNIPVNNMNYEYGIVMLFDQIYIPFQM